MTFDKYYDYVKISGCILHIKKWWFIFFWRISKGLCSTLITIKTAETQKNILYVYLSLFLPLLSERENYKRFTTSLLRRVGKAYTQSFNLDLGSFHTIASEALKWRESEGRLSFNQERSKKYSTFQIFLRQYYMQSRKKRKLSG